eukprot:TRINITY_DN16809_c1_g1_i1.p1 TRINITY_DN16809_c1_g1~~TRINITY_DN16809_c1_g1_i1.p1  ORF type:complete len:419 (+),score=95.23 TRINITY_DN16809_c1_g1_i1:36-1259(+)
MAGKSVEVDAALAPGKQKGKVRKRKLKRKLVQEASARNVAKDSHVDRESDSGTQSEAESNGDIAAKASAEERLAAFGEAFWNNIEGSERVAAAPLRHRPPSIKRKVNTSLQVSTPPVPSGLPHDDRKIIVGDGTDGSLTSAKKRRRKKPTQNGDVRNGKTELLETAAASSAKGQTFAKGAGRDVGHLGAATNKSSSNIMAALGPRGKAVRDGVPATSSAAAAATAAAERSGPRVSAADKRRFMSGDVAKIRSKAIQKVSWRKKKRDDEPDAEEDREFKQTLRQVLDYVTPQLGKQERKRYEEVKLRALGGTLDKREKMPLWKLNADRKAAEATRKRKLEEESHAGVTFSTSKHRKQAAIDTRLKMKKEAIKEKKARREDGLMRLGLGAREKRGMAVIPQHQVAKFSQ